MHEAGRDKKAEFLSFESIFNAEHTRHAKPQSHAEVKDSQSLFFTLRPCGLA